MRYITCCAYIACCAYIIPRLSQLVKLYQIEVQDKNVYPSSFDRSNTNIATEYLPELLTLLLRMLFVGKDKDLKVGAIGQAIMQAIQPRVLQTAILIGLGVQMHFHFASRILIDTLDAFENSYSYSKVQSYE